MALLKLISAAGGDAQAQSPMTALAGLAGLLLGALVAGGFRLAGDKQARRADSQRAAMYELQHGAHQLRLRLRTFGRAGASPSQKVTDKLDEANGRFDLLVERVLCEQVHDVAREWRSLAERFWTGDSTVNIGTENEAWLTLHRFIGREIRRFDD